MAHSSVPSNGFKNVLIDFVAGSLGGVALVYVGQPFDTVKVKMQTFPNLYKGMVDCFRKTYIQDGIMKGLYAGTTPAIVANVAENSVLFAGYGFCQKMIMKFTNQTDSSKLTILENAMAGFLAAFGSSIALCPTELIKCKLQAMREMGTQRIGPIELTRQIIRSQGLAGMFTGLGATLLREMPGYFFFFGGYEGTREFLRKPNQHKDDVGLLRTMAAGAVGGCVFWIVIFPADVVKSRLQITDVKTKFSHAVFSIYRNEGILAFYNGLLPTLLRTVPATATLFVTYEYSKKWMHMMFG